jgi:hypothetical protein
MVYGKGNIITPSFSNRKDYTAEMLCKEADIISALQKISHVE